jgi:hypothetical protein
LSRTKNGQKLKVGYEWIKKFKFVIHGEFFKLMVDFVGIKISNGGLKGF